MWFENLSQSIGRTPLILLSRFCKKHQITGQIFAKLENLNPGLSKKDRIARRILFEAKQSKLLKENQPVVELTSGNTGIGLAIACAAQNHPFTAVMSKGNSIERARMMKALGASVVLVDQAPGSKSGFVSAQDLALVEAETKKIVNEIGAFRADQFHLLANENAHYYETGPEIWQDLKPNAFVDVS